MSDDWEMFEVDGRTFAKRTERDDMGETPWDHEDGHGPVSDWERRDKAPGERVLVQDRDACRFYDFAEAVRIAKADGWAASAEDQEAFKAGRLTAGQRAARAADADFERLRTWCADLWCYVGVIVAPVCSCCGEVQEDRSESLWGIESDAGAYLDQVAEELAGEIEPEAEGAA